jgi:hypothetical protein
MQWWFKVESMDSPLDYSNEKKNEMSATTFSQSEANTSLLAAVNH